MLRQEPTFPWRPTLAIITKFPRLRPSHPLLSDDTSVVVEARMSRRFYFLASAWRFQALFREFCVGPAVHPLPEG